MNQEQIKGFLIQIREAQEDFSVVLTGKESKKVNGFYRYEERTIYIHNRNFKEDSLLLHTAIHEYAHHLQICENPHLSYSGGRCHTQSFWALFHSLLDEAEEKGLFTPLYRSDKELIELAQRLKERYLKENASQLMEFGRELTKAYTLCLAKGVRFEDFLDRCLGLQRSTAKSLMNASSKPLDPALGWDKMKTLARIQDEEQLKKAQEAFQEGKSNDYVRENFVKSKGQIQQSESDRLLSEKNRIERTIRNLERRLDEVNRRLNEV